MASFIACVVLPKEDANTEWQRGLKGHGLWSTTLVLKNGSLYLTLHIAPGIIQCIVVPWDCLLQIYHVYAKCWELRWFDYDHIFGFPLDKFVTANSSAGIAVAVETKLNWSMAYKQ